MEKITLNNVITTANVKIFDELYNSSNLTNISAKAEDIFVGYLTGIPIKEIAAEYGITASAVRDTLKRCLWHFKRNLAFK